MIKSFLPSATVFTTNGERIIQAVKCIEHRELGDWYVDLVAPLEYQSYLEKDYILVVPTKEKGDQPFRINNPKITDKVDVRAYHIGFDTRNYAVELSTILNGNAQACLDELDDNIDGTHPFTFTSAITTLKSFSVVDSSLYNALIQIADEYNGILDFNEWNITISSSIGSDNGVILAYGKNIQESEINENWDLVVTKLKPIGNDGITLTPAWLDADVTYDKPYTKIMNFDSDDVSNLGLVAQLYLDRYKVPRVNYKVKADVEQNVALGDAVTVNARQFTTTAEVLSFDYNPLINRVIQVEFGNFRPTLKQFFSDMVQDTEEKAVKRAQAKIDAVNGEINLVVGDVANLDDIVNGNLANGAGLTLTPSAITTSVRSSTEYTTDLASKENNVFKQSTAPSHLNGRMWLDTSVTPNIWYRSNGSTWIKATPTQASEVGAYTDGEVDTLLTNYSTITQTATDITLAVGTVKGGQDSILPYTQEDWESGALSLVDGSLSASGVDLRTKNFLTIKPSTDYILQCSPTLSYADTTIHFYNSSNVFLAVTAFSDGEKKYTTPATATKFKVRMRKSGGGTFLVSEMPNHYVRVITVPKYLKGARYEFTDTNFAIKNNANQTVLTADINGNLEAIGKITATSGKIGRFDISGDDLVYTSDLFNKEYDYGDIAKLQRILAGLDTPTAYENEVYDVNSTGTLTITDLVMIGNYVKLGDPLPTPRRQIRSVIRIGTTSGELRTTSISALGNTGSTFVMKAENLSGELLNVKGISAKGGTIELLDVINGVRFPSTFVGSNDVYTLDDYREGTWAPVLTGETTSGTGTYSVQSGRYTKNGNVVKFDIVLAWSAHTGTGNMGISLPFANGSVISSCSVVASNLTFSNQLGAFILASGSKVFLQTFGSNGARAYVNMDTTGELFISGSYMV